MGLLQKLLALYQSLTIIFVRLPLVALYSLPKWNRPRSSWTIRRVLWLHALKSGYLLKLGGKNPDHTAITGGPGVKGVWVSPTPHLIQGEVKEWAEQASVECVRIPGYWMDKKGSDIPAGAPPTDGEKVLLHLHGGGYRALSAHPSSGPSAIPRGILKHVNSIKRTFNLEYRLTKPPTLAPEHPFPAALLDAIAGYNYLVNEVGFAPESIIVDGDSAGGNLALALVRYLIEQQGRVPSLPSPPSALLLLSPWTDLGVRGHDPDSSIYTCLPTDFINPTTPDYASTTRQYLGPFSRYAADTNRYISPGSDSPHMGKISFDGFPRTFITAGGAEALRDQIRTLNKRMVEELGEEQVEYHEFPDAIHDFIAMPIHEPERTEALKLIAKWVETS